MVDIITKAAEGYGLDVRVKSAYRPGDSRQHGKGRAIDVNLIDRSTGEVLSDYQTPEYFRTYELFAQTARVIQMRDYPELNKAFRWGGYFSGPFGKYGALDLMHFDLGGLQGLGMAGGSWENGLTSAMRKTWGITNSVGMRDGAPPVPPAAVGQSLSRMSRQELATLQGVLAGAGYNVGRIDGLAGPQTRRALAAYQADLNTRRTELGLAPVDANGTLVDPTTAMAIGVIAERQGLPPVPAFNPLGTTRPDFNRQVPVPRPNMLPMAAPLTPVERSPLPAISTGPIPRFNPLGGAIPTFATAGETQVARPAAASMRLSPVAPAPIPRMRPDVPGPAGRTLSQGARNALALELEGMAGKSGIGSMAAGSGIPSLSPVRTALNAQRATSRMPSYGPNDMGTGMVAPQVAATSALRRQLSAAPRPLSVSGEAQVARPAQASVRMAPVTAPRLPSSGQDAIRAAFDISGALPFASAPRLNSAPAPAPASGGYTAPVSFRAAQDIGTASPLPALSAPRTVGRAPAPAVPRLPGIPTDPFDLAAWGAGQALASAPTYTPTSPVGGAPVAPGMVTNPATVNGVPVPPNPGPPIVPKPGPLAPILGQTIGQMVGGVLGGVVGGVPGAAIGGVLGGQLGKVATAPRTAASRASSGSGSNSGRFGSADPGVNPATGRRTSGLPNSGSSIQKERSHQAFE